MTEIETAILDLERQRWKYPGAKEAAAMERLRLTPTRYHQLLQAMIDRPDIEAADPMLVRRLRRLRDRRRAQRSTAPRG